MIFLFLHSLSCHVKSNTDLHTREHLKLIIRTLNIWCFHLLFRHLNKAIILNNELIFRSLNVHTARGLLLLHWFGCLDFASLLSWLIAIGLESVHFPELDNIYDNSIYIFCIRAIFGNATHKLARRHVWIGLSYSILHTGKHTHTHTEQIIS